MAAGVSETLAALPAFPDIDFSEFGEIEVRPLSRIQKLTGAFLSRNWVAIPHVTHSDEVDVTEAEDRRRALGQDQGIKLTPVVLLVKALAHALGQFPQFNASLSADGQSLIYKKFVHIGVAVDTPGGLLVPVLRDCDRKDLATIAGELSAIAEKARTKGLAMQEMMGSSMSISSIGHIGGTAFTPIVNAPDVAILGSTAIQLRPAPAEDGSIIWRKMLPLSLSYDHRVINGADAARFVRAIGAALAEPALVG
jgi:pyruvate dehydrogenase E2 component (dihydrolipoamide acetyltransferase)